MKDKQESTDYEEDIPFQENWKRYDVDTIKRDFCNWLDHNIENEYKSHPNLFMKEEEKRLYIHIQEKGSTDEDPEDEGYYCIVEPFETKRALGLKTDKKNFHSFRHTVSDHLKQKGIEPHFINELLGHSSGNIDLDRYGKGYNPDILYNKCVKKISYQTSEKRWIDFKILKMDWEKIITNRDY